METIPVVACFSATEKGWIAELDALLDLDDGDSDVRADVTGATFEECKAAADRLVQRLSEEHGRPVKVAYLDDHKRLESTLRRIFGALIIERHAEFALCR